MTETIINVKNFKKSFGDNIVIDGLNFEVKKGEIFAFLGSNGSGKTTTIRSLLGIYNKDGGDLLINDKNYEQSNSSIIGYLPEDRGLYMNTKVKDIFGYFGELKGLSNTQALTKAQEYIERVGLSDKMGSKIKDLSSGQQQKIQLGITIINNPEILILDEPTRGLDPINRSLFMDIILDLKNNGTTILFSSHQMDEVEKIADRVLILHKGQSGVYGEIEKVKEEYGGLRIKLRFDGKFPQNKKMYKADLENHYAEINPEQGVDINEILGYLLNNGLIINKFEKSYPSLNEIFITLNK